MISSKTNRKYGFISANKNHHLRNANELQFHLDIDGEDEYVDEELLSINDNFLSVSTSSSAYTANTNNGFEIKKTRKKIKNNFFTLTTSTAQQAARQLIKLFTNTNKQKSITKITRTLTTTLKAASIKHDKDNNDEEFTDNEAQEFIIENEEKRIELSKNRFIRHYQSLANQQQSYRQKQYQIHHHRIPFHQKDKTKNLKSFQIRIDRFINNNFSTEVNTSTGLGFTIVGYCPCQIGKVESNSVASSAGLVAGDLIIKINGKNVSRATCDSIVKIIKNSKDQFLLIDICRVTLKKNNHRNLFLSSFSNKNEHKLKSNCISKLNNKKPGFQHPQPTQYHLNNLNHASSSSSMARLISVVGTVGGNSKLKQKKDTTNSKIGRSKTAAFLKEQQYHHRKFITMNNKYIIQARKHQEQLSNKKSTITDNCIKEDEDVDEIILAEAEAAAVIVAAAATVTSSTSAMLSLPSPIPYLPPIKHQKKLLTNDSINTSASSSLEQDDDECDEYNMNKPKCNQHGYYYLNRKRSSITDSDYKTQSSTTATDNDVESPNQPPLRVNDEKYIDVDGHMQECEQLFRLEEEFISLMQSGVQQYSRPLRHLMMISQLEHHLLFQNIEKILVLSEYQLNQLISHDESTLIEMFNTIGKLYENKIRMSCEAFDIYLNGIEKSFNLLISLIKNNSSNKKFNKFLYDSKTEMDLKTFLLLPLYYVSNIHKLLKQIRTKITTTNCDYVPLTNLINSLDCHVKKSNMILSKYDQQMNKNPLCQQNDLIHSGTLRYKHKLVNFNLYKDRLHIISTEINQTIHLNNIIKFNFNLVNKLEFQFSYINNNDKDSSSQSLNIIRLRAHNFSEKQEWNKYLTEN